MRSLFHFMKRCLGLWLLGLFVIALLDCDQPLTTERSLISQLGIEPSFWSRLLTWVESCCTYLKICASLLARSSCKFAQITAQGAVKVLLLSHPANLLLSILDDVIDLGVFNLLRHLPVSILRFPIDPLNLQHLFLHNIYRLFLLPRSCLTLRLLSIQLAIATSRGNLLSAWITGFCNQTCPLVDIAVLVSSSLPGKGLLLAVCVPLEVIVSLLAEEPLDELVLNLLLSNVS